MKKIYVVFISILLFLVGCNNSVSNKPINEEKQLYDFILSIQTDKSIYEEEDIIKVSSYFEYVGEEIEFDEKPQFSIVIENKESGSVVKQVAFENVKKIMKKGDEFSQTIKGLRLQKGNYQLYVGTSFSVGPSNNLIITTPREFEVK
ncbi:hypothetical protein GLW04_06720 [Halobacillus litoralis]|uniref:Intracellular proteinase inhibitor BsuPI domain-containing protein n=1 Tax=Halobacillus litoralis TaxID=45668 RepID=A0A845DQ00_9BACI|nr:hypothetical protein [Halobacillus litoralis]MYL19580.1 hypothetical protein [Halobacillus litoralis]MYL36973.1 hypothetical protein [Halobacillus litoralis]